MGKHNGKARKSGLTVGSALVNRARREGRVSGAKAHMFTTEVESKTMQSVVEHSDLDEMMAMASLADRDFSAEKQNVVVISSGSVAPKDVERAESERLAAEERHRHRLTVPRRPHWTRKMTAEQLDAEERASFLTWRRGLAELEGQEALVLTPFEKNLEVWRQLWRVLERSDVVVQVVDARDPLTYACQDLEKYALELHATKHTLLLLNKADLLPPALRVAWADWFDAQGARYAFWSAKAATAQQEEEGDEAEAGGDPYLRGEEGVDSRARLLTVHGLMDLLHRFAQEALAESAMLNLPRGSHGDRLVVGLTGYPNVGKSSTINALFGSKKTAVAATPGKTKHFQTLNVDDDLMLCDCPGLVMPQYAKSKAEMVAAGVIPVDRLTDVRAPVAAVAARVSRRQFAELYTLAMPRTGHATEVEVLRALALSRGWVAGSGLPDETRTGRRILKDYVDGRLLYCRAPPNASAEVRALVEAIAAGGLEHARAVSDGPAESERDAASVLARPLSEAQGPAAAPQASDRAESASAADTPEPELDVADLDLLEELKWQAEGAKPVKQRRAAHKFQKKPARSKGTRGTTVDLSAGDGSALLYGKRGGLMRIVTSSADGAAYRGL